MSDPCELQAGIDRVELEIEAVGRKEERLESALEGNGTYLGVVEHVRF